MSVSNTSLEIIRINAGLKIIEFCEKLDIPKSTYYNIIAGDKNISETVIDRIGQRLNMPFINILHFLDRLYQSGTYIMDIYFPDSIPQGIQDLIYREHPVFNSKYNGLFTKKQGNTIHAD